MHLIAGKTGARMNVSQTTEVWFIDEICRDMNRWLMTDGTCITTHHGRPEVQFARVSACTVEASSACWMELPQP